MLICYMRRKDRLYHKYSKYVHLWKNMLECLDDEYQIRRKSLELGIPVLTTLELADSFVKTLEWLKDNNTYNRDPIAPYDQIE